MVSSASSRRPFGWVIAGVVLGALTGYLSATGYFSAQEVARGPQSSRERVDAAVRESKRTIPFVFSGCATGVLFGLAAEQFARRQRRIEAVLMLVYGVVIWLILRRFLF